jgi:hypothetical protein
MCLPASRPLLRPPKCWSDYNFDLRVSGRARQVLHAALFVALLTIPAALSAQETGIVTGHVVDARTGAPLSRVLVLVEGVPLQTQTDDAGAFRLPPVPAGMRRLFVSVVGYILVRRDVQVLSGTSLDITIPLSEGTGTYTENVTVAADRFRETEPAVASQQVLGSADIQNLRGVLADDPLRAVQVLPGVATGDDLRSEFSVRGSDFMHMNMTVEGFSTPYLLHTVRAVEDRSASGSVAMINSDILEDVTLLNGGYAQRYGDRTGAELDFRLREGSRERSQARIAVSGTSASVVGEGPLGREKRGSWLLTGRQSYLQLIVERLYPEGDGFNFSFRDTQAKVVYDLTPAQRVEFTMLAGNSKLEEQDEDLDAQDFFTGRNASAIGIGSWRLTRPRGILTARAMAAMNRFSNATTELVKIDRGHDKQFAGRLDGNVAVSRHIQVDTGLQAEWTNETRFRQRFSGGRYRPVNDFNDDATRTGAYVDLRATAGRLTVIPGVRADRWTLTGETTASPWVQGELKLSPRMTLRGGTGIYRQFPEFDHVIGTLGSRNARASRAEQYDLGLEHRIAPSFRWQITAFDREERGFFRRPLAENRLVNGRVVRGQITAPYQATLEGFARGVELLLQRRSTNGISGWLAYSYSRIRTTDTATGETYWHDLDQRHAVNLYLSYRVTDRTSISAKARVGSNVPAPGYYIQQGSEYFLTTERNTLRLPTYSRVDVRANRTFNWAHKRLTLFAEVINLFDRDNVRFNPPGVNSTTRRVSNIFETMIPIVPSAGILIEF